MRTDSGYIVYDTANNEYFCGLKIFSRNLRDSKIYHSEKWATESMMQCNNSKVPVYMRNRNCILVKVDIQAYID